jgi:hypothetical protein
MDTAPRAADCRNVELALLSKRYFSSRTMVIILRKIF